MMSKKPLECVVLWLQNSRGAILNITRKDDQTKYGLVGGKVDDTDVDIRAALNREVLEETGIDISSAPHKDVVTFDENGVPVHCFILDTQYAALFPDDVFPNAEGTMVGWTYLFAVLGRNYSEFYEYNNKVYQYIYKDHKLADHLALGRQHVFDFVSRHLLTQNAKAIDENGLGNLCAYLSPCGCLRCALGCLIHPLEYRKHFEGSGAGKVTGQILTLEQLEETREVRELVKDLQDMHDSRRTPVESWKAALQDIAEEYKLDNSVLSEYSHL